MKIPLLLAAVGAALMLLYPKNDSKPVFAEEALNAVVPAISTEQEISEILSSVQGAGAVKVMLTVQSEGTTEYQTDRDETNRNGETVVRTTTVFGSNSADSALVVRKTAAEYLGAVVVAEGAESAQVRYSLTKAVSSLTGLPVHKITVLIMK